MDSLETAPDCPVARLSPGKIHLFRQDAISSDTDEVPDDAVCLPVGLIGDVAGVMRRAVKDDADRQQRFDTVAGGQVQSVVVVIHQGAIAISDSFGGGFVFGASNGEKVADLLEQCAADAKRYASGVRQIELGEGELVSC